MKENSDTLKEILAELRDENSSSDWHEYCDGLEERLTHLVETACREARIKQLTSLKDNELMPLKHSRIQELLSELQSHTGNK